MRLSRAYKFDAGADVILDYSVRIEPWEMVCVNLHGGIKIGVNEMGIILPRSSTLNKGILVFSSPIDCGYNGDVHVWLYNITDRDIDIKYGTRVCSIVIIKIRTLFGIKPLFKKLRGEEKFGSSGE